MTSTRDYLQQLLIPAKVSLSSPVLRAYAVYLEDALKETPEPTEEMCEEAVQCFLMANRGETCDDLCKCLNRLLDAGWNLSKGESGECPPNLTSTTNT